MAAPSRPSPDRFGHERVPVGASSTANRHWWDAEAPAYLAEHGDFLGGPDGGDFLWGPEGLREADVGLLGDDASLVGRSVLELGAGAAQCSRWLAARGARPVALDLSAQMLRVGGAPVARVQADALALPLAPGSVDLACSAYGAVPFVDDLPRLHREVARVLRPGARWVFSTSHPVRWAFPDDAGPRGLTAHRSYFDRTPYVEARGDVVLYAEHHRTLGDHVRALVGAGFVLLDVLEPEWPPGHDRTWGGWSPLRGRMLPGTAVFVCRLG